MIRKPETRAPAPVGSFVEAARFRLSIALELSYGERLRDLEAMWDFNEMLERRNPQLRVIAARLQARREATALSGAAALRLVGRGRS